MSSITTTNDSNGDVENLDDYYGNEIGFQLWLHDLADALFPFPGYREGQGEALYEALEALFINGYDNVILDLPTGVGKSPLNVTLARVFAYLASNQRVLSEKFGVSLNLNRGDSFYTTPQRSLRNQLANDDDLEPFISMLAARSDYICSESGKPCDTCPVKSDPERSCMETPGCDYWGAKMQARQADIAALTFAMLIVDANLPPETEEGAPLSFRDRDLVIVDEGHGLENQAASLFAGFSASPWSLPVRVYGDAANDLDWDYDRYEDVEETINQIRIRASNYVRNNQDDPDKESKVEKCETFLRKLDYAQEDMSNGNPWVVNITETQDRDQNKTKKIELKPVFVGDFLENFIWSRGKKRVISSATIPYRDSIGKWCERIGLPGNTKLISKDMPFPKKNRLIHTDTITGSMSGDNEEENWSDVIQSVKEIHSNHYNENGLIHTASYERAKRFAESYGEQQVMVQNWEKKGGQWKEVQKEQSEVIAEWQESDKDILVSPAMTEGVDLHGDRCRWQVLLKVPYAFVGDSRVSYLLNERHDWRWYFESTSIHIQQAVGRAVRGPENIESASFYVTDSKFEELMIDKVTPPQWFWEAISDSKPDHWDNSEKAPWR